MELLLQVDRASEVVGRAVAESGWIAGLLVLIVISSLALFGVFIKGDRFELREINKFVRSELPDVIDGNTVLISRFVSVLHGRPCLHDSDIDRLNGVDPRTLKDGEVAELDGVAKKAAERIKRRAARRARTDEDSSTE